MNNRFISVLISLGLTVILTIILVFLHSRFGANPEESKAILRILTLMGGDMPFGLIQSFTFFLFFYGIFEIIGINRRFSNEEKALSMRLLPEKENWILSPADVASLKLEIMNKEQNDKSILSHIIIMVCTKFRSNKSTSESLEVLSAQVKINKDNDESDQSLIRYVAWAIPSVGFIGTVIGIASSLGAVKSDMSSEDLIYVTTALNVAFDTTLLALMLSLILMYMFHNLQERMEKFHSRVEQYVLENLINRIYHS
ncbi:MAG: MotA/TolQ/ExbB proton channel family protein [Bacteroidales bacterium]|nr:MotA/TolQ/ExbB proton channel family protein [Bacteroidales bacterium]